MPSAVPASGSIQLPDQGNATYTWNFYPAAGSAPQANLFGSAAPGAASPAYSLTTKAPTLALADYHLSPGDYRLEVTATNLAGRVSAPASIQIQLTAPSSTNMLVYPNPWRSDLHAGKPLIFGGLASGSTVKIFTVSGHWVRTLQESGNQAAWTPLVNDSGQPVQSGLYLYLVTDPQGAKSHGKFAIIR